MKRLFVMAAAVALILPAAASAQVFGQFTTAAVSSEVEGGAFITAGEDAFRTGGMMRFAFNSRSDLGIQLGFDRFRGQNSVGAGIDFKLYLMNPDSPLPVDIAIDGHLGHLRSDYYNRNLFGISVTTSGVLQASTSVMIEPFASLTLRSTYFSKKTSQPEYRPSGWPSADDDWSNVTETIVRAGAIIGLTREYQIHVEIELNGETMVGGALIVAF
ncbi:MAG TPA: hypothetical protein VMX58_12775 [Patescibacteria group bacterium]|nr:hypothetical protein [Patescibacteria group bacterium]